MVRTLVWLALIAGCGASTAGTDGGGAGDGGRGDGAIADAGGDAPPDEPVFDDGLRAGVVQVLEAEGVGHAYGIAQAAYLEAPTRMRFVHYAQIVVVHAQVETMREGACRLLEHQPPFCTACDGVCVAPEVCEPYPTYASAGTLDFTGLSVPLSMAPEQYWYTSQSAVPEEAFADDAAVAVAASGADIPAHALALTAVPRLVTTLGAEPLPLIDGEDLTIQWTSAEVGARVRLLLNANNIGHGNPSEAVIECEGPDRGVLTVPRALIEAFPAADGSKFCVGSDCPLSLLTRYRTSSTTIGAGNGDRVVFTIGSQREFLIVHAPAP